MRPNRSQRTRGTVWAAAERADAERVDTERADAERDAEERDAAERVDAERADAPLRARAARDAEAEATGMLSHSPRSAHFLQSTHAGRDHALLLGCCRDDVAELRANEVASGNLNIPRRDPS